LPAARYVNLGTVEHFLKNTENSKKEESKTKHNTYKRETRIKRHFPCIKTFDDKMGS
jgi:hypothetical protein